MPIKYVYCDYGIVEKRVSRPLKRLEKLDSFVLMNKQITHDMLLDLGFNKSMAGTLKGCEKRTGVRFVPLDTYTWNILID